MKFIDESRMKELLSMKEAIEAVAEGMKIYSSGQCQAPLRTRIDAGGRGTILFMPAYTDKICMAGIKIVSVFPGNVSLGKPPVPATMLLISGDTGEVVCAMDGTYLTKLRTGAVQGLATKILSREDSKVALIIGCGSQAPYQVQALLAVRSLEKLYLHDIDMAKAQSLAGEVKKLHPWLEVSAVEDPKTVMKECDIVIAVTTSKKPVIFGHLLKEGAFVCSIGSFTPDMQEIDVEAVKRAGKIFVDTKEGAMNEAGDVINPIKAEIIDQENVVELGRVLLREVPDREDERQIIVFKSVGLSIFDLMTAYRIYEKEQKG